MCDCACLFCVELAAPFWDSLRSLVVILLPLNRLHCMASVSCTVNLTVHFSAACTSAAGPCDALTTPRCILCVLIISWLGVTAVLVVAHSFPLWLNGQLLHCTLQTYNLYTRFRLRLFFVLYTAPLWMDFPPSSAWLISMYWLVVPRWDCLALGFSGISKVVDDDSISICDWLRAVYLYVHDDDVVVCYYYY